MNIQEKEMLDFLLHGLMEAQDNVTHLNEKGPNFAKITEIAIEERNNVFKKVISFVEDITTV